VRHPLVWEGKWLHRTGGDDGGTAGDGGKHRKTAVDGGGRHNVVRSGRGPGPVFPSVQSVRL